MRRFVEGFLVKVLEAVCSIYQNTSGGEQMAPPLEMTQPQLLLLAPSPQGALSLADPAAATSHLLLKEQHPHLSHVWYLLNK